MNSELQVDSYVIFFEMKQIANQLMLIVQSIKRGDITLQL